MGFDLKSNKFTMLNNILSLIMFIISIVSAKSLIIGLFYRDNMVSTFAMFGGALASVVFIGLVISWFTNSTMRFKSGIEQYIPKYTIEENHKIWESVKNNYKYLGVTGKSIKVHFIEWIENLPQSDKKTFQIILMKPGSQFFKMQVLHKHGYSSQDKKIPESEKKEMDLEVESQITNVESTVKDLMTTKVFRQGRLQIRYYDEYLHHYMEIIDNKRIVLGLLQKGHSGHEEAVLILKPKRGILQSKTISLFDTYADVWDRLWENGIKAV